METEALSLQINHIRNHILHREFMFRSMCMFEVTLKFETQVNPKCKKQIKGHSSESGVCVCVGGGGWENVCRCVCVGGGTNLQTL